MGKRRLGNWLWEAPAVLALAVLGGAYLGPHHVAIRVTQGDPAAGRAVMRAYGCASCHTIPGVPGARATVGPPLTHLARRSVLAGLLANNPHNLERWIENPHAILAATDMPDMGVTPRDARNIAAYLYTLH